MVCIESITTTSGFSLSTVSFIIFRFVSQRKLKFSVISPILFALIFICLRLSSPEIYRTSFLLSEIFLQTCKSSVDFPIPGSPPTNTSEPLTTPPPSTLSSSSNPVCNLSSSSSCISESLEGFL